MKIQNQARVKGAFSPITIIRGDGSVEKYTAPNLILNSGIARATSDSAGITSDSLLTNCLVGTGTGAPLVTDTELQSPLATSPNGVRQSGTYSYDSGADEITTTTVMRYTFALGAVVGNLSEIGIRPSSVSNLFSRALIVDGSGDPTTITVTADDQLIVDYTLTGMISRTINYTMDLDGSPVDMVIKRSGNGSSDRAMIFNLCASSLRPVGSQVVNSVSFDFPAWNVNSTLTGGSNFTAEVIAATNPTAGFKRRIRIPTASGNISGGFNWFKFLDSSVSSGNFSDPAWFVSYSSNIPKTSLDLYELEFITTFVNVV